MFTYGIFLSKLVLFSLIDVSALGFFQGPTLFLSRCFFYAILAGQNSFRLVCAAGFFALLSSFIATDSVGADLVIMIPLGIVVYQMTRLVDMIVYMRALIVLFCMFIHALVIDVGWAGLSLNIYALFLHFILALVMV